LIDKGKRKRRAHCQNYTRRQEQYCNGERTFDFDAKIYGHEQVKTALKEMQQGKCAFCESKVTHIAYGDVEHFRPKGGFRQQPEDPLGRPGYYWLAYDWNNLLFACQLCNQRFKKNLFPLEDPAKRARNHHEDHARERPMLIDPAREDPDQAIGFRSEYAFGRDPIGRGAATIDVLRLNRIELSERRRDVLIRIHSLLEIVRVADHQIDNLELQQWARNAEREIQRATQSGAEYAAMARSAVESSRLDPPQIPPNDFI